MLNKIQTKIKLGIKNSVLILNSRENLTNRRDHVEKRQLKFEDKVKELGHSNKNIKVMNGLCRNYGPPLKDYIFK